MGLKPNIMCAEPCYGLSTARVLFTCRSLLWSYNQAEGGYNTHCSVNQAPGAGQRAPSISVSSPAALTLSHLPIFHWGHNQQQLGNTWVLYLTPHVPESESSSIITNPPVRNPLPFIFRKIWTPEDRLARPQSELCWLVQNSPISRTSVSQENPHSSKRRQLCSRELHHPTDTWLTTPHICK